MRFIRRLTFSLFLLPTLAHAGVSERAYDRAVDLVDRLYLYPDDLEESALLHGAARGLADEVPWLLVETEGNAVYLRHGSGEPLGSVSVASMATLPEALRSLEGLVAIDAVEAGYDLDGVDPRLEILKGTTRALDRYSRVLAGERLERFDVRLKGTLVGIGATLRLAAEGLQVQDLVEDGPATRGGLQSEDLILRIDGVATVNMPLREATRRIRGEEGTRVVLTVQREEEQLDLVFVRAEVVIANVHHEVLEDGVGYIQVTHFSQRTVQNLVAALDALRNEGALEKGLVIDLRGNTGGSMKEAARSADQFLKGGMLLRTAGPDGGQVQNLQARMDAVDAGDEPALPLAVLMDRRTASGSEILAGALLELDRAALIGTRSYGKGTVQKIYNLDDETRLKLTVAEYLLAGDRAIAAGGLLPDAALADVELDDLGVRYRGWSLSQAGKEREQVIPVVLEKHGWRGQPFAERDVARELARRTVLRAAGPSREEVLEALGQAAVELRAEEEAHLVAALEAHGLDWSPLPEPTEALEPAYAEVRIQTRADPERQDVYVVSTEVVNHGEQTLHRATVELICDSFRAWSGLVVPIGKVEPGARANGEVAVRLPAGEALREDVVSVTLRADGHTPLYVGQEFVKSESHQVPRVGIEARLTGEGETREAHVVVRNLSAVDIEGLEVFFASPGDLDVELVDRAVRIDTVVADGEANLQLTVRIGADAPAVLPMELVVESDRYRRLADWPADLPMDGSTVILEPPRIEVAEHPLAAPVGPFTVSVRALDDRRLEHLVLYQDGHKAAWADGGVAQVDLSAEVRLDYGTNRLTAVTRDDQGLVERFTFVVRGEAEAAVDATLDDVP
jgi:carboxyl-terminal processing protease